LEEQEQLGRIIDVRKITTEEEKDHERKERTGKVRKNSVLFGEIILIVFKTVISQIKLSFW
jgi:hypothetical protein